MHEVTFFAYVGMQVCTFSPGTTKDCAYVLPTVCEGLIRMDSYVLHGCVYLDESMHHSVILLFCVCMCAV